MNILITGGSGYIGKSLYSAFKNKYNVTSISRKNFDLKNLKSCFDWFQNKTFDVVIHTAAVGGSRLQKDDESVLIENIDIYNNVLSCKKHFNKMIYFGSGAEIFQPNTFYGTSKKIISESINKSDNVYNLRIFGVFDENELETRFIKSNIIRYIKNEPIILHNNKQMDFFYMKDVILLVKYYIQNSNLPKTVDCSYKEKHTLMDIANYINTLSDYKVPIIVEDSNKFEHYCGTYHGLPINEIGLFEGINQTAKKLI
jgi:nucleoside-diphosphate-sugar epimerase